MVDALPFIILFFCVLALLILFNWITKWSVSFKQRSNQKKAESARKSASLAGLLVNCPVCDSPLLPGENLVSKVYRPMNVSDQLCHINGCPHCYPVPEPGVKRICPVCGKPVPVDSQLVARLFNKTDGKKHVLVMGCPNCCRNSPK